MFRDKLGRIATNFELDGRGIAIHFRTKGIPLYLPWDEETRSFHHRRQAMIGPGVQAGRARVFQPISLFMMALMTARARDSGKEGEVV